MNAPNPTAEVTIYSPLTAPARQTLHGLVTSIGRASECAIPIKDRYLSRHHAEIVSRDGRWVLKDCGSANGTYLNGVRVEQDSPLRGGDRIRIGDTEIVFETEHHTDRMLSVGENVHSATIAIPVVDIDRIEEAGDPTRLRILNLLAMELSEDRPLDQLFGFILDRVMEHISPSRAALGLLAADGRSFVSVEVRRQDPGDTSELAISHTLLSQVVEERKALAFMDVGVNDKLSRAKSIVMQGIHSVLCAPMMIGDSVVGVLYVDFLFNQRTISPEDVRLVAQVARFAAIKLETTRLREESIQKRLIDEELRTAAVIQRRLLPDAPTGIDGYTFAGSNRPCRSVSGDYFDFALRTDGKLYFVIADVSGKGVTAALLMAGLQAAFRIFTKSDPTPAELVSMLNVTLKENLPKSKFVTLFVGRLEIATGIVEYANAGHVPPLLMRKDEVVELAETDLILGIVTTAGYRNHVVQLSRGDALVMFTDGVSDALEDADGSVPSPLASILERMHGHSASEIAEVLERVVVNAPDSPMADDVTLVVVSRNGKKE
jgi:sigma-B regulation protein RsbU (phosphoserine phosphatase)